MPVIRWLFNHMVIVFLAVLIILGAVYQDRLEKELTDLGVLPLSKLTAAFTPSSKDTASKAEPTAAVAETASSSKQTQMPTHLTQTTPPSNAAPAPSSAAPAPVATAPVQAQNNAPMVARNFPPQGFQPQFGQAPMRMMPQQFNQQPARPAFVQPPALDDSVKEAWIAARTAFWQRDLVKAEELYKKLVTDSGEADAAGELGNVYLMQNRTKEAADMYYQAAQLHLDGDNPMMAASVVAPLSQLAPEKAQDVRQKIMTLQAKMSGQAGKAN